ncbi:MAG: DEAD/DEAH box helicase [Spirochaetota bacterium]
MTFETLGLSPAMLQALAKKGFEEPTPIQGLAIPRLLTEGPAIAARARTGTGKTAAFGIPLIEKISSRWEEKKDPTGRAPVAALVLVPTRELALQVTEEISSLRYGPRPRVACVYGGASIGEQLRRLSAGVDIVVGTPGRVLDHIGRGSLDVSRLEYFILDEADEMLDMGFIDDIRAVMETMNPEVRMLLFSATMAPEVLEILGERTSDIEVLEDTSETLPTELAEQLWIEVHRNDKLEALSRIVDNEEDFFGIVFVATKVEADKLASSLIERGYEAEGLHGDLSQDARERVLGKFRDRRLSILVATDVAARGLDIEKLTHVINWSLPHDPESYLHRVGRTGRAGNSGTAITFVTPEEYRSLFRIKRISGSSLKKGVVPEVGDILEGKKERLSARIASRIAGFDQDTERAALWKEVAKDILSTNSPEDALAAALAEGFAETLDPGRYKDLMDVSVDGAGTSRLFVSVGRRDRIDARSLVAIIKKLSNLSDRSIESVEIYDTFSFVTVPYKAAESIIEKARASGGFPLVKKATPKNPAESGKPWEGGRDFRAGKGFRSDRGFKQGFPGKPGAGKPGTGKPERTDRPYRSDAPRRPDFKDRPAGPKAGRKPRKES